jgi:hypothetical protein
MEWQTDLEKTPVTAQAQKLGYAYGWAIPKSTSALLTAVGCGLLSHAVFVYEGMEEWKWSAWKHADALVVFLEDIKRQYESGSCIDIFTSEAIAQVTALLSLHAETIASSQLMAYRADQRNSWPLLQQLSLDLCLSPIFMRRSSAGEFLMHRLTPLRKGMVITIAEEAESLFYLFYSTFTPQGVLERCNEFPFITDQNMPVEHFRLCEPPANYPKSGALLKVAFSVLNSLREQIENKEQLQSLQSACNSFISASIDAVPEEIFAFAATADSHDLSQCIRFDYGERQTLPCGHEVHSFCWERSGQTTCPLPDPCSKCSTPTQKRDLLQHACQALVCVNCLQTNVCPCCEQPLAEDAVKWVQRRLA